MDVPRSVTCDAFNSNFTTLRAKAPRQHERRGASALVLWRYCFEPVVLLFGFGEQFRFCGFASFSHAAMLAYLQFNEPLADVLMQNGELPIVCDFCMLLPDEGEPIVPCAWAKDIPATNAATVVKVVNVFIISLLGGIVSTRDTPEQLKARDGVPGTRRFFGKSYNMRPENGKRPGKFPAVGSRASY
jgi:hypothetical protein